MRTLARLWKDETGLETVEYAIITGLIVAATITAIGILGAWVSDQFERVNTEVGAGGTGTGT
ncbi:MAG: Flp family type IVb pilin [Planctomycetota bacterium]